MWLEKMDDKVFKGAKGLPWQRGAEIQKRAKSTNTVASLICKTSSLSMLEHTLIYFGSVSVQLQRNGEHQEGFVTESDRSDEEKVIDQLEMAQLDGSLVRDARKAQVGST